MPDFQASLLNADDKDDLVLSSDAATITITEHSNYTTSDEVGHLEAHFSLYRKIIVTDDNGNTFTFASVGDPDEDIDPGDSAVNEFEYTADGDSLYKVRLITIPTWQTGVAYLLSKGVYVARTVDAEVKIYKILANNTSHAPEDYASEWEEVTDETLVSDKYNVLGYLAVIRDIEISQAEAVEKAKDLFIEKKFTQPTGNLWWVKAATLDMVVKSVANNMAQGNYDEVSWTISKGKEKTEEIPGS